MRSPWLDFGLDASKQVLGVWLLVLSHPDFEVPLPEAVAQASFGMVFEYLLLLLLSWLLEQLTQCEDFRPGQYRDEKGSSNSHLRGPLARFGPQLGLWLLCVCGSSELVARLGVPELLEEPLLLVLEVFSWSPSLAALARLVLACCAMGLQFRLTDAFLQAGGLPLQQALALAVWAGAEGVRRLLQAAAQLVASCTGAGSSRPLLEPLLDPEKGFEPSGLGAGTGARRGRGSRLKAQVASEAEDSPVLSPRSRKPKTGGTWARGPPLTTAPGSPLQSEVAVQFESLSGMFAERDAELRELHAELDGLVRDLDLPLAVPSGRSPGRSNGHSPSSSGAIFTADASPDLGFFSPCDRLQTFGSLPPRAFSGQTPRTVWGSPQSASSDGDGAGLGLGLGRSSAHQAHQAQQRHQNHRENGAAMHPSGGREPNGAVESVSPRSRRYEAGQFQLARFGRPLADEELLSKAQRLDFWFQGGAPPAFSRPRGARAGAKAEVTIMIDGLTNLTHTRVVQKGTSVAALKRAMAAEDPTGLSRPEDFELGLTGGSQRPLAGDVVLSDLGPGSEMSKTLVWSAGQTWDSGANAMAMGEEILAMKPGSTERNF
ncbi:unnamed protein product [Effrenium voratum]|nr:unnamed protein product [Effrenium voratum]